MIAATPDEREGLPSCSALERLHACPGSWHWSKTVPQPQESDDATSGTRIHNALAKLPLDAPLSDEEERVFERCEELRDKLLAERGLNHAAAHLERRLWLTDGKGQRVLSGKADLAVFPGSRAFVLDYKTGRNPVPVAKDNLQLRGLIACAACEELFVDGEVAIVQPWANPPVTVCHYTEADVNQGIEQSVAIARGAILDEGRTLAVGDHCKYCPAKGLCPATRAEVERMAVPVAGRAEREVMTPAEKLAFWRACNRAVEIAESFRAHVKRELEENPQAIPGLHLKPGAVRTKVTDVAKVFSALHARYSLDGPTFAAACSITKTDLKALAKSVSGKKGKELDALVEDVTAGAVEEKQSAPSVEEDK